jgi:glycosyltransferase involved in cell wall biosynthesis
MAAEVHECRTTMVVVGVPAFNEEQTVARVVLGAQKCADIVVVCDDGSTDFTAAIAERLGADVIRHGKNLGYGAAIQSLFKRAQDLGADVLVTLDADGQHDPSEVPNVVKPIVENRADIVVGSRFIEKHAAYAMPWYRRIGVKLITKLTGGNSKQNSISDGQSGFRGYSRKALENLVVLENGMGASAEILINARKQGLRICEVSSSCSYDNGTKTSTHNPFRHGVGVVASVVKLIVEDKPLTMLGIPGIVCLIVGASFGAWMLQIYGAEHRIITNIALASIAFIVLGFFALSTAITLYAIARFAQKTNRKK